MAKPFKKIDGDLLSSTIKVCSDDGQWNEGHAEWLRKPGNAALVREFMEERTTEEPCEDKVSDSCVVPHGYHEGLRLICKPLKKMSADLLSSTIKVCSDDGPWDEGHAEWLRKPGNALLVRDFMNRQMAEEARLAWIARNQRASDYGYPEGWRLKPLDVQAAILKQHFPGLDVSCVNELAARYMQHGQLALPEGMDGLVVIPKPSRIASTVRVPVNQDDDWPIYNLAMRRLLEVLGDALPSFHDGTRGEVRKNQLRRDEKTTKAYESLFCLPGDVIVLAVQTGLLYRGKSPNYVRELLSEGEFGLDAFAVGCIILTHPERLVGEGDLAIDCLGTMHYPDDRMCGVPTWFFHRYGHEADVRFFRHDLDNPSPSYGAATARLPKR